MSTNYGLAGGKLDATRHVELAIPRLLSGVERAEHNARLRRNAVTVAVDDGRTGNRYPERN